MANGKVKRLVADKGFGFIRGTNGTEYFFHSTAVDGDFTDLREGDAVTFEEVPSAKGPRAEEVRAAQP
jgi:CspA family cold shock protein